MSSDEDDSMVSDEDFGGARRKSARGGRTRVNYSGMGASRNAYDDDDDDDERPRRKGAKKQKPVSSDEEGNGEEEEPMMEIETLVSRRSADTGDMDDMVGPFEYLIKWKNISYLHCEWMTEDYLLELAGPRMKTRIKRFNQTWEQRRFKQLAMAEKEAEGGEEETARLDNWMAAGEYFDPALTEIEKIVAVKTVVEAIAPPPAPLPVDPNLDDSDGTEASREGTPTLDAENQAQGKNASQQPQLAETDIVPNTNVTLGDLRQMHAEYNYPPHRQELFVRDMKRLLEAPKGVQQRIVEEKTQFAGRVAKLEAELSMASQQAQESTEQSTVDYYNSFAERTRSEISAVTDMHQRTLQDLEGELQRLQTVSMTDLKLAPRQCYLVKWKSLSYVQMTWEWPEAINDDMKIALFKRIETPPTGVQSVMSRADQVAARALRQKKKFAKEVAKPQEDTETDARRAEMDLLRFKRAAETLPGLRVPAALTPYALQLEVSGLAQIGDEIICVNGVRCTGLRTEEINKMIKENTSQVRVLRFLRRETGHELEIKFDTQKRMGFVMDELKQNMQPAPTQFSWAQRMANKRKSNVEYSAWVKKFPTPDDFSRGGKPAPPDHVNPAVRAAVLAVFSAREAVSPLTLDKLSAETGVSKEYLHQWLLKDVPQDDQLKLHEQTFQLWVARCAQAFSTSPSVDIGTIEASLIAGNPRGIILQQAQDSETFSDHARAYARSLLATAQNELLGTESRFEAEARRQEMDFMEVLSSEEYRKHQEDVLRSQQEDPDEDDDPEWGDSSGGISLYTQQLRRIQQLQSGAVRFTPYGPNNLPRFKNANVLREYQLQGVNWLVSKWYEGKNCILADEMGLGKTVQVVAFLEHLRSREQLRGPFLIIAPLSTMGHWRREFENWTDANVCFYYDAHGGNKARELVRQYEWFYEKLGNRPDVCKFNVLLTTYETFLADVDELSKIPFLSVVVDEGHRLKNQEGRLFSELRKVQVSHRLLLSGTPLQNNLMELWSLLNFCEPEKFFSSDAFLMRHSNLRTAQDVARLQQEIAPYMLRRVKEDVEKSIPPKEETIVDVELTTLQKKYYRAIYERNREFLYKGCKSNNKPQLVNVEIELRKCCNHPFLITGAREKELGEANQLLEIESVDMPLREKQRKWAQLQLERLLDSSGKLFFLDKLLIKLRSEGRKVLIFSQMVKMLDLLKEYLELKGWQYERLDGSVHGNTRQAAIDRFSKADSKSFVFLLSTRAGGVGINLTAADTAIIFDSDWNPQNDAQAQARCHRIGQSKPVTIYRLVTKNSYEETMLDRAAKKLGLEQAVLGSGTTGQSGRELKPEELERMLRLGAYHHLQPSAQDEEETANFMSQDIESLLRTRTRKIKVDGIRGTVSLELTHNTLQQPDPVSSSSAAKSPSDTADTNIDVNDPDFWTKMLPKEDNEVDLLFKLGEAPALSELKNNAEAKFKFVKRVRELVEEILRLREQGEVIDHTRMDTTMQLLVQMSVMRNVFGGDTCNAAQKWAAAIEASKERKSRAKARELKEGLQLDEAGLFPSARGAKPVNSAVSRNARATSRMQHRNEVEEEEDGKDVMDDDDVEEDGEDGPSSATGKGGSSSGETSAPWGFQACHGCYDASGNDLFPCSGKCKRAFHPGCYKAGATSFSRCNECQLGGKCAVCDVAGPEVKPGVRADSTFVKKCAKPDCGHFFHRQCLSRIDEKLVSFNVKGGEPDDFYCPTHKCSKCGRGDGPAAGPIAVQCIRCYKAFHIPCMDAAKTKRASKNLIVCPDHLKGRTFPLTEHTKYGELTKRKPVARTPKEGAAAASHDDAKKKRKRIVDGGSGVHVSTKRLAGANGSGSAGPAKGHAGGGDRKVAPIVLKIKPM